MKINRLETHDRLQHFKKDQSDVIAQGAEDCLKKNPDSLALQQKCPYIYIFAHPRTHDDGITKRMLWQPRLSKPEPQVNSYLFRAQSNTDMLEICWMIPPEELWDQYTKGKVTQDNMVMWSIDQFIRNKHRLGQPHPEDFDEEKTKEMYRSFLLEKAQEVRVKNMYSKELLLPWEQI